jgi:micrococcal nuclease
VPVRAALALALVVAACGGGTPPCGPATAKVLRAVDGDTLELEGGQKVRLILVNTPEITSGKNECYGQEGLTFTTAFAEGKTASLVYDPAVCKDRFDRLLAYVTVDGKELNRELVSQGFACAYYVSPGGSSRKTEFEDLESVAKTNRTGLWGACTTVTCGK